MSNFLRFLSSSLLSLSLSSLLVVFDGDESSWILLTVIHPFLPDPFQLLKGDGVNHSPCRGDHAPLWASESATECDEGVVNGGRIPVQ